MSSFFWPIVKTNNQTIINLPLGVKLIEIDNQQAEISLFFDDSESIIFLYDFKCINTPHKIHYNPIISHANINLTSIGSVKLLIIPKRLITLGNFDYNEKYISESFSSLILSILCSLSTEEDKVEIEIMTIINIINISLYKNNKINVFEKAKQLLLNNIDNPSLSLDFLADQLCISRRKLQYVFNENNTSYNSLIGKIRLNIINENINNNYDLSSKELGRISGFKNVQSLNRFFYKHHGLSLKEHKNKIKSFYLNMENDIQLL
ncbi:helix-turn-helix domain-containing protein [Photobacterium leiognathi]|uniref:helix-turn-helix domain-containing protein n=1 Tax=Photobacterium leiognathi TaxID=553611 RepID=UPI002736235C|nr:helix-turn-helix domain-containing protein [Photobacterium leiognathi]